MKLIISIAAILATASSDPIHVNQPTEQFSHNSESYQSALEQQQQGVYGDQSQYSQLDFSQSEAGYSQGHSASFPGTQTSFAGQSTHAGQNELAGAYQQQNLRPSAEKSARIISFQNDNNKNSYQYSYETENGIKVQERGELQGKSIRAQGAYSYTGDDGQLYTVTYTADENGFHPQGGHLPTPPPIPEAIQKSIEQNQREAASNNGVHDDGSYKEKNELIRQQQRHQIQPQHLQIQPQQFNHQIQPEQFNHQIQPQQFNHQIQQLQEIQPIQQEIQHQSAPETQNIPEIQQIQQIQQFQHGQKVYEPRYQQEYQQEVTATTAGYNGWQ